MHLLVYTGQVSGRLNDKLFSWVGVLYNLDICFKRIVLYASSKIDTGSCHIHTLFNAYIQHNAIIC